MIETLYDDILSELRHHNKTFDDVTNVIVKYMGEEFVKDKRDIEDNYIIDKDDFIEVAKNMDFLSSKIRSTLKLLGDNWWLEREYNCYDMENWAYREMPSISGLSLKKIDKEALKDKKKTCLEFDEELKPILAKAIQGYLYFCKGGFTPQDQETLSKIKQEEKFLNEFISIIK